ncbi:hypothetical protein CKJ70_15265 [Mycobacterium avium]|nr:hypothetical protein CKJ70_15265 [Mycobacterium avium]
MIGPTDFQIILGKVRPLSRPHPEAHPQVLIIARAFGPHWTAYDRSTERPSGTGKPVPPGATRPATATRPQA